MHNSITKQAFFIVSSIALLALVDPSQAKAQTSDEAQTLYDQGYSEWNDKHYDTACPKLARSLDLEPKKGTLFYLAWCEADMGRYASAATHFTDYMRQFKSLSPKDQATQIGDNNRPQVAQQKIKDLTPLVARLTIKLPNSAPPETKILIDGEPASNGSTPESELFVKPGLHKLSVRTPDGIVGPQKSITLDKGQSETVELEIPAKPSIEPEKAHPEGADKQALLPPETPKAPPSSPMRTGAFVVGGVGVVGLGLGVVMGALVANKAGFIHAHCPNATCDQEGFDAYGNAKTYGRVSEIGFGVGAVGLGVGTLFFVLSRPAKKASSASIALDVSPLGTNGLMWRMEGRW